MTKNHVRIGTVVSKHGFKGLVKINILSFNLDTLPKLINLFIDIDNCLVPFMIEEIKSFSNNLLIIKFIEISSEKEANEIIQKNVFIDSNHLGSIDKKGFFYDYLINFSVFKESKKIGVIENIITELPQPVFEVKMDSKKVMIPIHEDLIEKIDKKQKIIYIDIPDGLTEII